MKSFSNLLTFVAVASIAVTTTVDAVSLNVLKGEQQILSSENANHYVSDLLSYHHSSKGATLSHLKVDLGLQLHKLRDESEVDFNEVIGTLDTKDILENAVISTPHFETLIARIKHRFNFHCTNDDNCISTLKTKVAEMQNARIMKEAAADPNSKARGLDDELVSLRTVIEAEAALEELLNNAKAKLVQLGLYEADAATARDYKGAAKMQQAQMQLKEIIAKFSNRQKCNSTSTEPECSLSSLQALFQSFLEPLKTMKMSGDLSPATTTPGNKPLDALLKIYQAKWQHPSTTERDKTVLVFIMKEIRKADEIQDSLDEAVKGRQWERADVLKEYAENAERALVARLTEYYKEHDEVKINTTDVESKAAESAVQAILEAENYAKKTREDITAKCGLTLLQSSAKNGCNVMDTDFGCTYDVAGEQSMWVHGGAEGCSGKYSCYGQIVFCQAQPNTKATCQCNHV